MAGGSHDQSEPATSALWDRRRERAEIGPQLAFAAAILLGVAALGAVARPAVAGRRVPVVSTAPLVFAAICGVIAWRRGRMDPGNVTYTDVAGALTLIGICAAATIDPEQMIRLVQDAAAKIARPCEIIVPIWKVLMQR